MQAGAQFLRRCSRCGDLHGRGGRYCLACHNAYMREWRKTHPLTPEQRRKDRCRSYANVYKRKGHLVPKPCIACGESRVEMHHADYSKPLAVTWVCRPCHLELHRSFGGDVSQLQMSKLREAA